MIDVEKFNNREECEKIATLIHGTEVKNSSGFIEYYRVSLQIDPNAEWNKRLRLEFNLGGKKVEENEDPSLTMGDFQICIYEDGNIEYQNWMGTTLKMKNLMEVYQLLISKFSEN